MAKQQIKTPPEFVDAIANLTYTAENIERARQYCKRRGINPDLFTFPWTASGSDPNVFNALRDFDVRINPHHFTDTLFIPIPAVESLPTKPSLAGFDCRYMGDLAFRNRWIKRKRTPETLLVYNVHAALKGDAHIITEGAMDAEAFRTVGFEAIGALTALKSPRFVHFLYALGSKIFLAFDNDPDGQKAATWIMDYAAKYQGCLPIIKPLQYHFKDPNQAIEKMGASAFHAQIAYQLT